jgi:predicted metal-binding membrane protein
MSTSAPFVAPSLNVVALRQQLRRRPEAKAMIVIVVAWSALIVIAVSETTSGLMDGHRWSPGYWMLMTVAMMGPAALAGVRHTAVNSLSWRRSRAMLEFGAGYVLVWMVFGATAIELAAITATTPSWRILAFVLAAAALWQLTPLKLRWLRDCHRSIPLPPTGWSADRAALQFGARNGLACVGSCWCLMLVMLVTPSSHILWTLALTAIITTERAVQRPLLATRRHSAALAVAALLASAVAISG